MQQHALHGCTSDADLCQGESGEKWREFELGLAVLYPLLNDQVMRGIDKASFPSCCQGSPDAMSNAMFNGAFDIGCGLSEDTSSA